MAVINTKPMNPLTRALSDERKTLPLGQLLQRATDAVQELVGTTIGRKNSTFKDFGDFHFAVHRLVSPVVGPFGLTYTSWGLRYTHDVDVATHHSIYDHVIALHHEYAEYKGRHAGRPGKTIGISFRLLDGYPSELLEYPLEVLGNYGSRKLIRDRNRQLVATYKTLSEQLEGIKRAVDENCVTFNRLPKLPENIQLDEEA